MPSTTSGTEGGEGEIYKGKKQEGTLQQQTTAGYTLVVHHHIEESHCATLLSGLSGFFRTRPISSVPRAHKRGNGRRLPIECSCYSPGNRQQCEVSMSDASKI